MIVLHLEVSAIIIEGSTGLPVVAGIYIQFTVEHVGRRVSHIVIREKITWFHLSFVVFVSLFYIRLLLRKTKNMVLQN